MTACAGEQRVEAQPPPAPRLSNELHARPHEPDPAFQYVNEARRQVAPSYVAPCELVVDAVPGGAKVEFHALGEDATELRARVRQLADAINVRDAGPASDPKTFGLRRIVDVEPRAEVHPMRRGAALVLYAADAEDLLELRTRVRWYASEFLPDLALGNAACPLLPSEPQRLSAVPESDSR